MTTGYQGYGKLLIISRYLNGVLQDLLDLLQHFLAVIVPSGLEELGERILWPYTVLFGNEHASEECRNPKKINSEARFSDQRISLSQGPNAKLRTIFLLCRSSGALRFSAIGVVYVL